MTNSSSPACAELPGAPDPEFRAALSELVRLGLVVARVAARLAEVEGRAVEALAEAAVAATRRTVGKKASYEDAIEAGRQADVSDVARDGIAARVSCVTAAFEKAARSVRRTIALQARLADGRPFGERAGRDAVRGGAIAGRVGDAGRIERDDERSERLERAEPAERMDWMDTPDWGDEIGARTAKDVMRDVRLDLANSQRKLGPKLPAEIRAICVQAACPLAPVAGPPVGRHTVGRPLIVAPVLAEAEPRPEWARRDAALPEPDS